MYRDSRIPHFITALRRKADASAVILGSPDYPDIYGVARFYQTVYGVIVALEVSGLPRSDSPCSAPIFAFHIHDGMSCTGNSSDYFANARSHYNPYKCPHPYHAGDAPPLFGADGYALSVFLSDRFTVKEILGRTVIIHSSPDDFTSQPAGNAGTKIACGIIK